MRVNDYVLLLLTLHGVFEEGLSVDRRLILTLLLLLLVLLTEIRLSVRARDLRAVLHRLAIGIVIASTLGRVWQFSEVEFINPTLRDHLLAQSSFFRHFCHDQGLSLLNRVLMLLHILNLPWLTERE